MKTMNRAITASKYMSNVTNKGVKKFREYLLAQNLCLRTVNEYASWANALLRFSQGQHDWNSILRYKEFCQGHYSPATQKVIFSAINHFVQSVGQNNRLRLPRTSQTFKKETISFEELSGIINGLVCENYFLAVRNRCILKLLWETGMRISELLCLKWADVGAIHITVTSKGNKTRHIPYKGGAFDELLAISRSKYVVSTTKGKRLSYSAVNRFFKGLQKPNFTPHSLRHSYASRLLHNGVPINYVSELLVHSSIDTTLIYLHYKNADVIKELELKDWSKGFN